MVDRENKSHEPYVKISCGSCGKSWKMSGSYSVYGAQAVESEACPECGAYTLCFEAPAPEPEVPLRLLLNQRRRMRGELLSKSGQGSSPE